MKIFSSQRIPGPTEEKTWPGQSTNWIQEKETNKQTKTNRRETNFSGKRRHATEMDIWKCGGAHWTISVWSLDTPLQHNYDRRITTPLVIIVAVKCFSLQASDPLMKGNDKIYSALHYIHRLNERLKCSCLLQSDRSHTWLFSCCLSRVSMCVSKNNFAS